MRTIPLAATSGNEDLTIIIIIKVSNEEVQVLGRPCKESTSPRSQNLQ